MLSLRHISLVLLLPIVSVMTLWAESRLAWLPDDFDRVTTLPEVVDGAYYLVAGTSQRDGHVMMCAEVINKKLFGAKHAQQDRICCEDGSWVWQIFRTNDEVILRAALAEKYLYAPQSNKPEVELQAGNFTTWILQQKDDGFVLKHPDEKYRYLHTSYASNADNSNPFGNYSFSEGTVETNVLYLYKLDAPLTQPTDNRITYLKDGEKVPAYGNLIVQNGKLCGSSVLLDGKDFLPSQAFTVSEGQLRYTRTLQDGCWETLCLPFTAKVPEGIEVRELTGIDGEQLCFTSVSEIRPHVPVILRSRNGEAHTVTFVSQAGTIAPPTYSGAPFSPNYQHMAVADASEGIFMLTASGKTFVLTDAGSVLRPFRAFIQGGDEAERFVLQLKR